MSQALKSSFTITLGFIFTFLLTFANQAEAHRYKGSSRGYWHGGYYDGWHGHYYYHGKYERWPKYYAYYGGPAYYAYPYYSTYSYSYPSYYTSYIYPSYPYEGYYYQNGSIISSPPSSSRETGIFYHD